MSQSSELGAESDADAMQIDGSEAIFAMYLELSLREDKEMIEVWNQDAKSILLFSGLFSATVAAALGPSLPDLSPDNSQDLSAFYLAHIYAFLTTPGSLPFSPLIIYTPASGFKLVSSLWFLSLVISLTCALLAISLQQWMRRYLEEVRQRGTLYNQARIREYLAEGIHGSGIAVYVDIMRVCHQFSFLLFAMGLLVYFYHTDFTTFFIVLTWFVIWAFLYISMTIAEIFRKNSPYHSPLSSFVYRLLQLNLWLISLALHRLTKRIVPGVHAKVHASDRFERILERWTREGMRKETEESTQKDSQRLDRRTLQWTFDSLHQDHEFERFFAGIPDFCTSRAVENPKGYLLDLNGKHLKLSRALFGLMHRTVTSPLISEPAHQQRLRVCTSAIIAVPTLASGSTIKRVFEEWEGLLGSFDFGSAVLRSGIDRNDDDPPTAFHARCIVAIVIARARVRDGHWFNLTTQFLLSDMEVWDGIPLPTPRGSPEHGYSAHGTALLAILVFITRIIHRFHSAHMGVSYDISSTTLSEMVSHVNVQCASPEMQREYCRLWNELVGVVQLQGQRPYKELVAREILRQLRQIYDTLHESADAPGSSSLSSYTLCNFPNHRYLFPPNITSGATEGASDTADFLSQVEASSNLAVPPSTVADPPLAAQPSVEITPTEKESHNQIGEPPSVVMDSTT